MRRFLTPSWLALHVLAIVLVIAFVRLGFWQWDRATSPNGLLRSYGYALQWPVFALFVIFMWVKMVRDDLGMARTGNSEDGSDPAEPYGAYPPEGGHVDHIEEEDDELAAYNRYLAGLNDRVHQRR